MLHSPVACCSHNNSLQPKAAQSQEQLPELTVQPSPTYTEWKKNLNTDCSPKYRLQPSRVTCAGGRDSWAICLVSLRTLAPHHSGGRPMHVCFQSSGRTFGASNRHLYKTLKHLLARQFPTFALDTHTSDNQGFVFCGFFPHCKSHGYNGADFCWSCSLLAALL